MNKITRRPDLPRDNDNESLKNRKTVIENISIDELAKEIDLIKSDINSLFDIKQKLNLSKEKKDTFYKLLNKNNSELERAVKSFRSVIHFSEQIIKNFNSISQIFPEFVWSNTNKTFIEKNDGLFPEILLDDLLKTLQKNNKKLIELPKNINSEFIKNKIKNLTPEKAFELMFDLIIKDDDSFYFSLYNFGKINRKTVYDNNLNLLQNIDFIPDKVNSVWKEFSNKDQEALLIIFNKILSENLEPKEFEVLNNIMTNQLNLFLNKKTQIGLNNTLLSLLILVTIFYKINPVFERLNDLKKIEQVKCEVSETVDNIKFLKKALIDLNINIPDYNINLEKFLYFIVSDKDFENIVNLIQNYIFFSNEDLKKKMFLKKVNNYGFNFDMDKLSEIKEINKNKPINKLFKIEYLQDLNDFNYKTNKTLKVFSFIKNSNSLLESIESVLVNSIIKNKDLIFSSIGFNFLMEIKEYFYMINEYLENKKKLIIKEKSTENEKLMTLFKNDISKYIKDSIYTLNNQKVLFKKNTYNKNIDNMFIDEIVNLINNFLIEADLYNRKLNDLLSDLEVNFKIKDKKKKKEISSVQSSISDIDLKKTVKGININDILKDLNLD